MSDVLEQLIEDSLARRAGSVHPGPRLGAEALIAAGRRARRRRTGVVTATVAALALGIAAVAVLPRAPARPTVAVAPAVAPGALGLDLLSVGHGVILRADGQRVRIDSPDADHVSAATRVPGGWVVEADLGPAERELLFVTPDGAARTIATYAAAGSYLVRPDGRTVVVTQVHYGSNEAGGDAEVAYALPSLDKRSVYLSPPASAAHALWVAGIVGAKVLLADSRSGPGVTPWGGVWDMTMASVAPPTADTATILGVSANGDVLFARVVDGSDGRQAAVCVGVVTLVTLDRLGQAPSVCHADTERVTGTISPDGAVALLDGPAGFRGMYRVADLRSGDATPIALPAQFAGYHAERGYQPQWVSTESGPRVLLDSGGQRVPFRYAACDPTGACTPIAMPDGLDRPVPVAHLG